MPGLLSTALSRRNSRRSLKHRHRRAPGRYRPLEFERFECRTVLTTVTLSPIADNTLYEPGGSLTGDLSNGAGQDFFVGQAGVRAGIRRGVIKFDVAGSIPKGA